MNIAILVPLTDDLLHQIRIAYPDAVIHTSKTLDQASDEMLQCEILIAYNNQLQSIRLDEMKQLRWIQVFTAGVDNLPLNDFEARSIRITTSSGAHKVPMAEFALGCMLQEVKQFIPLYEKQKQSSWYRKLPFDGLEGKTVSVLGAGKIGQEIARRAKVFGMRTIGVNRTGRQVDGFDQLFVQSDVDQALEAADFVIAVTPLTPLTRQWLDASKLGKMKPEAVFINLGRGEVVDEEALIHLLQHRLIKRAYLDVFQNEPLSADSPFWSLDNCIITPHISAISERYNERCLAIFLDNMKRYREGQRLHNLVEATIGY